jgi:hypothetical protein
MSSSSISASDPRLTAYACGELEAAEVPLVEAALRADPALRAAVEEIRTCTASLERALASEPLYPTAPVPLPRSAPPPYRRARWIAFPQFYYITGGLAAAILVVLVTVNRDRILEKERARAESLRVALTPTPAPSAAPGAPGLVTIDLAPPGPDRATLFPSVGPTPPARLALTADYGHAAYASLRQLLRRQRLPAPGSVQPLELLNAFRYRPPTSLASGGDPLATTLEVGDSPWAPARKLVRIGVHGRDVDLSETRQNLVDGLARTAATIARDVRIQVEFNPALIAGYRLVGSARDTLTADSPSTDLASAEQFFSGQGFCALFELVPAPSADRPKDSSRPPGSSAPLGDLLTVHLQFLAPEGDTPRTLNFSLAPSPRDAAPASPDYQLAAAVAEFALVLRDPPGARAEALRGVVRAAEAAAADVSFDSAGQRAEFLTLVKIAQSLLE